MKSATSGSSAAISSTAARVLASALLNSVLPERGLGAPELGVARACLLDALDECGDLVGSLDQAAEVELVLVGVGSGPEHVLKGGAQVGGQRVQQALLGIALDGLVGVADGAVVVLHGRGQVAGHDLGGVVVERHERRARGVERAPVSDVADDAEHVGDQRHLERVLGEVLGARAAHERPALDVLHAGEDCEEVGLPGNLLLHVLLGH